MKGVYQLAVPVLAAVAAIATEPVSAAVVHKGVAELTAQAEQIVVGDVLEVTSYWDDAGELIKSRIVVSVDQYLVGQGPGIEELVMSGGTVGDLTLAVSVLPVFEEGDHVLLFLGDNEIRLVESFQGAYLTDGEMIARMAPDCEQIIGETLQPLADFLNEIQQALPPGTALPPIAPYQGDFVLPMGGLRYSLCGMDWTYMPNPMGEDYRINPNCQDSSAGSDAIQLVQVQNGMETWHDSGADFQFTYGGQSSLTDVDFDNTNLIYWDMTPPDGGAYLAANYHWFNENEGDMTESDIVFNDLNYTWWYGSGFCGSWYDIWSIAAHELGHTLCLLDLYGGGDSQKTMYGSSGPCETHKRTLHSDDINGIIAIYGELIDGTPPEPDPMGFDLDPTANDPYSIWMYATEATDVGSSPVEYFFEFVEGGPYGDSSIWQSGRAYADLDLQPNTSYGYRVKARDSFSPPNETAYSAAHYAITKAAVPGAAVLTAVDCSSMDIEVTPNGNPAATLYSIQCTATSPYDANWDGQYVSIAGTPLAVAQWQTEAQWNPTRLTGMQPESTYTFAVTALNQEGFLTDPGPEAALSIAKCGDGDMDEDLDVDLFDFALWQACFGVSPVAPACAEGDFDGNGAINLSDFTDFNTSLGGPS